MSQLTWQQLLDSVTRMSQLDGLMQQFGSLKTDHERIKFCLERRLVHENISKWLDNNADNQSFDEKSDTLADQYRTKGNNYFIKGHNQTALELYTKGVIHAPYSNSVSTLSLLFGNRSAVYFRMENYDFCIQDIDCALSLGFPSEKQWKLYKRKAEACLKISRKSDALQSINEAIEQLDKLNTAELNNTKKLKHTIENLDITPIQEKPQQKIPLPFSGCHSVLKNASKTLDINYSESKGRFITATTDLTSGSIILREKPYAAVLLPPWFESHCQHCFEKLSYIIPCFQCTKVRYCSESCRSESWQQYHYFECGRLSIMENIGIAHLALRIILVTDLSILESNYSNEVEVLSCHNKMWPFDSTCEYTCDYKSVFHLMPNSKHMIPEDLYQYTLGGTMLYMLMKKCHYFDKSVRLKAINSLKRLKNVQAQSTKTDLSAEKSCDFQFIAYLLSRHIQQLVCNAHAITEIHNSDESSSVISQEQVRIATAIYPTTSLLNHSCEPSITNSFSKGGVLLVKLLKSVSEGEEIFNCYGPHYRRAVFLERKEILKSQYFFDCECEHCVQGEHEEGKYDAFKCHCGAGITLTLSNCCSCHKTIDGGSLQNLDKEADDAFMQGLQVLQSNSSASSIKHAIKKFEQCHQQRKQLLLKSHKKLCEVKDVISKCYSMLFEYSKSYALLNECLLQIESRYGEESVEVMHELLKMSDVAVQWLQSEGKSQLNGSQKKLVDDTLKHVDRAIQLVRFYHENDEDELSSLREKKLYLLKFKK